jgi:hypothetical protein
MDRLFWLERAERARARADGLDQERELARRRETEAHGARKQAPRRLEHEELPRNARLESSSLEPEERVKTYGLRRDDEEPLAPRIL